MPEMKTPVWFLIWAVCVLAYALVARIGWEIGGRIWAFL
jgi:hypothetical protein